MHGSSPEHPTLSRIPRGAWGFLGIWVFLLVTHCDTALLNAQDEPGPEPEQNAAQEVPPAQGSQPEASEAPVQDPPAPPPRRSGPDLLNLTPDPPVITLRTLNNLRFDRLRVVISLSEKRLRLFSGEDEAIDTPVIIGVSESSTPVGEFTITDMSREFFVPDFGSFVTAKDRQVLLSQIHRHYHYLPSGAIFQPQPKQLYMQFARRDEQPIGLRAGRVNGYTGTRGDIVVPRDVAAILFGSIRRGTPVIVEY